MQPPARPGRLGDPSMSPATDPRADRRLVAAMAALGLDGHMPTTSLDRRSPPEHLVRYLRANHLAVEALYGALPLDLPGDEALAAIRHEVLHVDGPAGPIAIHVRRPPEPDGPLPCVVYLHGGGMTVLHTDNPVHNRWMEDLAATGMVAIGVDFRNAYADGAIQPWPAGLDDCAAAVTWIDAHRAELGISRLTLQGESGGGNLVLATALRARRDGGPRIDGVYASVPYISGIHGRDPAAKEAALPSLVENDGYFLDATNMAVMTWAYDPTGEHAADPLAWPWHATAADLVGLPPHVISVNELDPLRDEGIAYARALLAAGVAVEGRLNLGVVHAAELIFRQALPDHRRAAVADIHRFASAV